MEQTKRRRSSGEIKMRTFNKVDFMTSVGFLNARYNPDGQKFESSVIFRLKCYLHMLLKNLLPFKIFLSAFYEREDPIQFYNFLDDVVRNFMSFANLFTTFWGVSLYLVFVVNSRNDYDLFLKWMRISGELSADNKGDFRVVGLSRKEYKNFRRKEGNFNYFWYWTVSWFNLIIGLMHCLPLFLLPSDASCCIYFLVQAFNALSCLYSIFYFLHSVYTTTIFALQTIYFLFLKFKCIGRRLTRLDALGSKKLNKHLARLILEFNRVQLELIEANDFYKNFLGSNMLFCFFIIILCMFLGIYLDWLLRVALLSTVFLLFLSTIMVPFRFANSILIQRDKTRRQLENLSFNRSVNVESRQKIDTISHLSDTVGFTCFDWFLLGSHKALLLSFELIIYILLLIQTYHLYTTGFYYIKQN